MLSHANLWLGAISVAHYLGLRPDDRTLAVLPLAFDYGQNQLLSDLGRRAAARSPSIISCPRDVVRAVGRHDVTVLAGVPPLWLQLAEQEWGEAGRSLAHPDQQRRASARAAGPPLAHPVPAGEAAPDVRPHRSLPLVEPRSGAGRRASRQRRHRHPLRRADGRPARRQRSRAGRGGRAGPCRAAGRAGLLERSRTHRRAVQAGAGVQQAGRHGGLVGRHGGRRARTACSASAAATTR